MTTEKMTVHEALCEVKTLDKRIRQAILDTVFCVANKASNVKIDGIDVKEYVDGMKASYQKINDLIKRNEAIKAALSLSNAATRITVAGKEMSVAEGIYMMQYGMDTKRTLLNTMNDQYARTVKTIQNNNKIVEEERLDKYIASTFGNKEKADPKDLAVATETFLKQQRYEMIDPLKIKNEIDGLQKEIDEFSAKIDSAIQISNATTYIEISY